MRLHFKIIYISIEIHKTMAQVKQCTTCLQILPYEKFSKNSKAKDRKQWSCKECNKKTNRKFRTEINPDHHAIWQKENMDKHIEIVSRFRKADKSSKIYYIKCLVTGLYYIGMTQMHLGVRWIEHKSKYNRWIRGKQTPMHPYLFESFKKWGIENHTIGILFESEDLDRKALRMYEKTFIKTFMDLGISLNKQI